MTGVWRGLYLGDLSANDEAGLRAAVTWRWPATARGLAQTITELRARIRQQRQKARALALRCGCRFHGTLLRIPRRRS